MSTALIDAAQPFGRGDRLQADHAGADDQELRRLDRADGRADHGDEPRELAGRDQHRLVAGDRAHRRQRIHRLGPGDARNAVHGQGRDPAVPQHPDHGVVGRGGGMQEGDQHASRPQHLGLVLPNRPLKHGCFTFSTTSAPA